MSRRRFLKITGVLAIFLATFGIARAMFWLPAIPSHFGDGTFENLSRRAALIAIPGYSISMPDFDLAKPHRAEYRVRGLSDIGRTCAVYLAIPDPKDQIWKTDHFGGRLQITLVDSHDRGLVSVDGRLGDYIWWGTDHRHGLYVLYKSSFQPVITEEYRIQIDYEPDEKLAGFRGFVYVCNGGHK